MINFAQARNALAGVTVLALALVPGAAEADGVVNIYTYRQPDLIKPVLDAFTAKTGIATQVLFLDKGLEERIAAEGQNSPADVIMTVDISRLTAAKAKGVTQPPVDEEINRNISAEYRDPDGEWFGVTKRARVVYASKDRVKEDHISYADLADPKWKGRICIRSGQHDYNIALFAAMIAHWGEAKTEAWMRAFKENLARKPDGSDRSQAKSIFAGECDIALGNTYYVGLMLTNEKNPQEQEYARSLKVIFPDFGADGGTHVNISGMALAKYAPNKDNAIRLMEFLSEHEAQQIYAEKNFEYPVEPSLEPSTIVKGFGELKPDTLPLVDIGNNRKAASEMVDRIGLNDGPGS